MPGKIAYAVAVGLAWGLIATFGTGCAGGRACFEVTRIDAVSETKKTFNGSFGDFWNGISSKSEKAEGGKS